VSCDPHDDRDAGVRLDASLARFRAAAARRVRAKKISSATVVPRAELHLPVTGETRPDGHVPQSVARWFLPTTWFFRRPR
jgi:hypothetical protein